MKHKILIYTLLSLVACALNAQTVTDRKVTWDYPVKPETMEWRETSYIEKIKKSQPPKELLKNWTAEILFQYCINYPFNKVALLFNNPNDGFKRVYEQSAVWQEFIQRKDAIDVLTEYLESRPYKRLFAINNIEERNNELFIVFFLDKIVSETNFTANLDFRNRKKLTNIILQNHQSKKNYPEEFTGFHYNSSLSAMLKVLGDEKSLTDFREKTDNEFFIDENANAVIIENAINFINK
jgi:hypothetical protein